MGDYRWAQPNTEFDFGPMLCRLQDQHHFNNAFYHHDGPRSFLTPDPDAGRARNGRSPSTMADNQTTPNAAMDDPRWKASGSPLAMMPHPSSSASGSSSLWPPSYSPLSSSPTSFMMSGQKGAPLTPGNVGGGPAAYVDHSMTLDPAPSFRSSSRMACAASASSSSSSAELVNEQRASRRAGTPFDTRSTSGSPSQMDLFPLACPQDMKRSPSDQASTPAPFEPNSGPYAKPRRRLPSSGPEGFSRSMAMSPSPGLTSTVFASSREASPRGVSPFEMHDNNNNNSNTQESPEPHVSTPSRAVDKRPRQGYSESIASSPQSCQEDAERSFRDQFLIDMRREGMSYKEIKAKGNFPEAESTLRGRMRTLTKRKEARVRRPEWTEVDILLLKEAVKSWSKGRDPETVKIPWTKVAQQIADNGGTYHFGSTTCHKKWSELGADDYDD